jgi:hypothetical protein
MIKRVGKQHLEKQHLNEFMLGCSGWEREITHDITIVCELQGNNGGVPHQFKNKNDTNSRGKMVFHPLHSTKDHSLNKFISLHYSENKFRYNDYLGRSSYRADGESRLVWAPKTSKKKNVLTT